MTDKAIAGATGTNATDAQGMDYLVSLPRRVVTVYAPLAAFLVVTSTRSLLLGIRPGQSPGGIAYLALTAGYTATLNLNPSANPMVSLPLAAYELVKAPQETLIARGFGAAAVLMVLVLVLFIIARIIGGRGPDHIGRLRRRRLKKEGLA